MTSENAPPSSVLRFVQIPEFVDDRGRLRVCEFEQALPFIPIRTFVMSDVPQGASRAGHAVSCELFMVVLRGSCRLKVVAGASQEAHHLVAAPRGVHVPANTWILMTDFAPETEILVHASTRYRDTKYRGGDP